MKKKIIDAKVDSKGNVSSVRLSGNKTFTPIKTAIKMADKDEIENAHAVHPIKAIKDYLRTNPDKNKTNNLDEMAKD
ncbi:MAG TPA: DUF3892 domain-containing protein [Methylophaga aminisulfidivorans]|uniref:DUF3892 domain-containing protein n=2 Tax=root TaxID=1 RepID=A0A7C1VQN1_9GAMM|nr:DUF3892 domain-containing protein [Methylophaga aminisulfidivorans]